MAKLALVDPLTQILGPVTDEWCQDDLRCIIYQSGISFSQRLSGAPPWTTENHFAAVQTMRDRAPHLRAWYSIILCTDLPQMALDAKVDAADIPEESRRGAYAMVIGSRMGAVMANWILRVVRQDIRSRCFNDATSAAAWILELKEADEANTCHS